MNNKKSSDTQSVLAAALDYIARGFAPVPIPFRSKGPILDGWQNLRITAEEAPQYFNGEAQNIGVILGPNGLTDIDLDCPEAIAAAPYFLLKTAVFGHASKLASHYVYKSNLAETETRAAIKLKSADGFGILEIRIGGGERGAQTVFPPSTHVSGEPIVWENAPIDISTVGGADLRARAHQLAAAAQLARAYPNVGARHDAAWALGGFLSRCALNPYHSNTSLPL
jgi:Bifunctional DNA primase/polymerase, N-terminal